MRQDSVEKNKWYADEGKFFRRKSDHNIVGNLLVLGITTHINGVKLYIPKQEVISDYEEISDETLEAEKKHNEEMQAKKYTEYIDMKIREKYSLSDELAIQRQRDENVDEFKAYYEYCEECKKEAKEFYPQKESSNETKTTNESAYGQE